MCTCVRPSIRPSVHTSYPHCAGGASIIDAAQDNATFIHIHAWSDGRTSLRSVGLLLQDRGAGAAAAASSASQAVHLPRIANALPAMTNSSLVPALLAHAGIPTAAPLLVYLAANTSLGAAPPLPAGGVRVARPLLLVGLASLPTSLDLQMVVNQLNETGGGHANVTFAGLILENLAAGDAETGPYAPPFSLTITNNVWSVLYNRCVPQLAGATDARM
jgi:hypothetical protein